MPAFDIVSEVEMHEVSNAVDQGNREIANRFDFNGSSAKFELKDEVITLTADADFQLKQMFDILQDKFIKRNLDPSCLELGESRGAGKSVTQTATLKQGLDSALTKKIVKLIKDKKMKVQAAVQGEKVRVTGKKRDDLQQVIALLKESKFDMPLQFNNFRD
ncbi:MAG TPA: YajQ family cyclic di-GMP-binding protein [Pseudomonadales bacterium]